MKNWQTTQYLTREELAEELNGIEKAQGLKIEQVIVLHKWQKHPEDDSKAYYLVLYRLADLLL